jgi:DNA-directed RNA polymerase specialized sigma24 family protein
MILRNGRHHRDDLEYIDEQYIPDEDMNRYDRLWIKERVSRLCKADAEILYLKYALELDHKAIARLLGISGTASRKRLQKARQ